MKTKFQRFILLAAAFIIALFNFSEVALAEDASSDPPPTIFWLDKANNTATYLGNAWFRQEKHGYHLAKTQWCTRRIPLSI